MSLDVQKIDLDALTDRREMGPWPGSSLRRGRTMVAWRLGDLGGELAAGVALVADQGHWALAADAVQQGQSDFSLVAFGGTELQGARGAVGREDRVQPHAPEEPGMAGAVAIVRARRAQRGALDGLAAAGALDRCGVDQQQIVLKPRAWLANMPISHSKCLSQPAAPLEVARLLGQLGEQVPQPLGGDRQKPTVRRDPHDRLRHAQRDDLSVCDPTRSVILPFRQEIVGRDKNGREQQVEVGVHRGPHRSAMLMSTADFDLAAP